MATTERDTEAKLLDEAAVIRLREGSDDLHRLGGLRAAIDDVLSRARRIAVAPAVRAEIEAMEARIRARFMSALAAC